MKYWRKAALFLILVCFSTAMAQDDTCGPMVQQALDAVQTDCAPTGRNQACYGYVALDATPRAGVQNFSFARAGDLTNVADVENLRLSALDAVKQTWGIALMKLQANVPDSLPGQNVTFLLFGNVDLQNAVPAAADLATDQITAKSNVNVRNGPSTSYGVIGSLKRGDIVTANGRSDDSAWLRIQIPDSSDLGWVSAGLVSSGGDVSALSVVAATDADAAPAFKPMQAFYFTTGIGKSACQDAPQDGILIQTPEGAGKIALRANDVDISLGSTGFFQSQNGANMTVSIVEGESEITSAGQTAVVPAGAQVEIPMDQNMKASGPPGDVHPYTPDLVANLPVSVLPQTIAIAAPADQQTIDGANNRGGGGPGSGNVAGVSGQMDFCAAMKASGMSPEAYLELIEQTQAAVDAASGAGSNLDTLKAMLAGCQ